ncbi:hypothetical protein JOF29_002887 [Kribbella aluminosa]|uniref:Alpha-L-fucosidase n=1 Tax=Kribbella aluminosa TaxID=416017 RepID=A0ABS4UJU5_9ACTN|nr:hypothetical protein [Kribbella aluminosa]MBP2351804.1 hypothetical protein [Kribbella aluminosa]
MEGVGGPGHALSWQLTTGRSGRYQAAVLARGSRGQALHLEAPSTGSTASAPIAVDGWDRIKLDIHLPAGPTELRLWCDSGHNVAVKAIELLHEDEMSEYDARLAAFRTSSAPLRAQFARSRFGLMFQYGPWSYPHRGEKPSIDQHVAEFDVQKFADWIASTGAEYLIWSATWWTYELAAPAPSVNNIVRRSGLTADRDLIDELSHAVTDRGMLFFLYYHTGQDRHLGYKSTDWWRAQQWPDAFSLTGRGDRQIFFDNCASVVSELGQRYGDRLSGWFIDDGLVFYPAPFERLAAAARAGNPRRLLSINSWIAPRYTDFQDIDFGEGSTGEPSYGSALVGGNGTRRAGPRAGLQEHGMLRLEDDWGVHEAGQHLDRAPYTESQLRSLIDSAHARSVPITLNMALWHPGVPDPASLELVRSVGRARTSVP